MNEEASVQDVLSRGHGVPLTSVTGAHLVTSTLTFDLDLGHLPQSGPDLENIPVTTEED